MRPSDGHRMAKKKTTKKSQTPYETSDRWFTFQNRTKNIQSFSRWDCISHFFLLDSVALGQLKNPCALRHFAELCDAIAAKEWRKKAAAAASEFITWQPMQYLWHRIEIEFQFSFLFFIIFDLLFTSRFIRLTSTLSNGSQATKSSANSGDKRTKKKRKQRIETNRLKINDHFFTFHWDFYDLLHSI